MEHEVTIGIIVLNKLTIQHSHQRNTVCSVVKYAEHLLGGVGFYLIMSYTHAVIVQTA